MSHHPHQLVTSTIIATQHAFDLAEHLRDEDLKQKIYEVYTLVMVLDRQMQALEEENGDLRRQLAERRKVVATRKGVFGYWFKEGETAPLCPVCCERDDAVSYLSQVEHVKDGSRRTCATCKAVFWELLKSELPVVPGDGGRIECGD
jgi:hypothetical protein